MGQLTDRFNNSAASLVAMCNQSSNKLSLAKALTELLAAVEVLEEKLAAQIASLQGPPGSDVPDVLLPPSAMGQLTDRFNNLAASLLAMCNQSGNKASLIMALAEFRAAVEALENQLAGQISRLGALAPVNILLPSISGTAQVGQMLTATAGTWTNSPTSFAYQWNRAGMPIVGATSSAYSQVSADIGNTITVTVTATNGFGSTPATSLPTNAVVDLIPTINTPASIPGTPQVGQPTTAIDAIWNNSVTGRTYQWKVNGVNGTGTGATTLTYTPVIGDLGLTLTITVIATNSGGSSLPSTSAPSAAVIAAGSANSTPYVVLLAA